nr:YdeI/OmpD-associated family protein [Elizabethkingia sp. ASV34]
MPLSSAASDVYKRQEYMRWITDAKKPETRENRKSKLIDMIISGKKGI